MVAEALRVAHNRGALGEAGAPAEAEASCHRGAEHTPAVA